MSEWEGKSDFEINKAVALSCGFRIDQDPTDEKHPWVTAYDSNGFFGIVDYCNAAEDSMPVMIDGGIGINKSKRNDLWLASTNEATYAEHENPLRAAMIVYLEMTGVKP